MKDFLTVTGLGREEFEGLIGRASANRDLLDSRSPIEPILKGLAVANLFFEPSTRTRLSFDLAAQRLGANVITFDPATSSTSKGETLRDTALTVQAIGADMMVVRHSTDGVPEQIASWTGLPVINAGDGMHEHPTQALLDAVTLNRRFGRLHGLRLGIVGDILHSRVAGSLIPALRTLGIEVIAVGPADWMPESETSHADALDDVLESLDAVYLLRVQTERGGTITKEFIANYQLNDQRAARLPEHAIVMHPGPMNRGVEISEEVADSARSLITEQVRNGVPARMAVFQTLAGQTG